MSCKIINGYVNALGAEVVGEGVSVHRDDASALKHDDRCFVMGDVLERYSLCCTRILPYTHSEHHRDN